MSKISYNDSSEVNTKKCLAFCFLIYDRINHEEFAENVQTALIVEPRKLDKLDKIINKIYYRLNKNSIYKWNIKFYCGKGLKTYFLPLFKNIEITIIELEKNNHY